MSMLIAQHTHKFLLRMLSARISSLYSRSFLFYVDYFYLLTVHFLCRNFPGNSCALSSATIPLLLIPNPCKLFAEIPSNSHLATRTYSGKIKSFADNLCFLDFSVSCQPLADNSNTWIFLSNVDKLLTFLSNGDNFCSLLPNGESSLPVLE
jgi:hypothetical protein